MELTKLQKDYVKNVLYENRGGSDTKILKSSIVTFAENHGLVFKKNITKVDLIDLIIANGLENELFDTFAGYVDVPYYDAAKLNKINYKQLSDLLQMKVIESLDRTGYKDAALYPLSILGFKAGELLEIWNNKNTTDFHRTRIDIKSDDEIEDIINQLSKVFEIQNVSKPYPHREYDGYYIYLSIRSLNNPITNDNYKNQENAKLKIVNSFLRGKIEELELKIQSIEADARECESYKLIKDKLDSLKTKLCNFDVNEVKINMLEKKVTYLEKMNTELKEKLNNSSGGRPLKFTVQEKETIKMYRLQGKSIRQIAKIFNCSTGLVHKIINQ
jgi:hypothetical protein|nr:hypothetical protein [Clostridium chromiireducens]